MKLELYILRQLLVATLFAVLGMLFIALPGIAVSAVHKLAGVDTLVLLKYLPLITAGLIPYIMPIGFLLAVVSTYGRLAADNEWTAIRMAGTHPLKVFVSPLLLAVVLGASTYLLVSNYLPELKRQQRQYLLNAVGEVVRNLSPGRTELQLGLFYLSSRFRDRETGAFLDAFVYIPVEDGEDKELRAESVMIHSQDNAMTVTLENWRTVLVNEDVANEKLTVILPLGSMVDPKSRRFRRPRYQTTPQLRERVRSEEPHSKDWTASVFEIHNRYAIGTTYAMFLLLGSSTGLILRRGTRLGALAVAAAFAVLYYVLSLRLGKMLGTGGSVHPIIAAWVTTGLGMFFGGIALRKALRE